MKSEVEQQQSTHGQHFTETRGRDGTNSLVVYGLNFLTGEFNRIPWAKWLNFLYMKSEDPLLRSQHRAFFSLYII